MEVEKVFRMVGGTGSDSYAANSNFQKKVALDTRFVVKEAVVTLLSTFPLGEKSLVFADLGCSSGANTFVMFSEVMDSISTTCTKLGRSVPEIQLLLNDLPGNDFNTLLGPVLSSYKESLRECMGERFLPFYTAAVFGSFYDSLFPKRSVHFIYSSSSIHWLSQAPLGLNSATEGAINKGAICISDTSPPQVPKLYLEQFQRDVSLFLRHRSKELYSKGHLVLIFTGRKSADPSIKETAAWISWLDEALNELVAKGLVKADDVDSFNLPFYFPSMEEVKSIIQAEGSFDLVQNHVFEESYTDGMSVRSVETDEKSKKVVQNARAIIEHLLASHFGKSIMDELFSTMSKVVARHFHEDEFKWVYFAISLKKR